MNKLTPLAKGIITGVLMIALQLTIFYSKESVGSILGYLMYIVYAAGIVWTLAEYQKFIHPGAQFGDLFGQGFRCFVIITLIMVIYTWIFILANPKLAEKDGELVRKDLIEKKEKLPPQIEEEVAAYKKHYLIGQIYPAIFGYLIIGSIITAAGSAILLLRRK